MNGDFEEENICLEYGKNCAPEGWISTSLYADYYFDDSTNAFTGKHFTGLILPRTDRPQLRNFLRTRLLCGLRKGATYNLHFAVRSKHGRLDSVGVYFSSKDFLYQKDRIAAGRPQVYVAASSSLQPTAEWQEINLRYTATGDEVFLNIGDFKTKGHAFKFERPDLNNNYYFFIDAISLTPVNTAEKPCTDAQKVREDEYDFNPRHDKLDRLIYAYTKNPPPVLPPSKTVVQRIDTFVIPDVLFATASYALNRKAAALLDSVGNRAHDKQLDSIVIEGHTDNQGNVASNRTLSENRAASVADYLRLTLKIPFHTRGWADTKPAADNRNAAGRQKNRRVEIYFYVRE